MTGSKTVRRNVCWIITLSIALVATSWGALAPHGAISDGLEATCRITAPDGSCGTGCAFDRDNGRIYVLTAAHVVGDGSAVRCEFWKQGHQSQPLPGEVVARSKVADAAIVAVPETAFGGRLPTLIPLAPRDYIVRPGETLASVGCANGAWSTGWKGHALGYDGGDLRFVPTPANGRSGSAIFDAEGRRILGIVRARTGDNAEGIATSLQAIYQAFDAASNVCTPAT